MTSLLSEPGSRKASRHFLIYSVHTCYKSSSLSLRRQLWAAWQREHVSSSPDEPSVRQVALDHLSASFVLSASFPTPHLEAGTQMQVCIGTCAGRGGTVGALVRPSACPSKDQKPHSDEGGVESRGADSGGAAGCPAPRPRDTGPTRPLTSC